jgi:lysozyme
MMPTKFGEKYPNRGLPWPIVWEGVELIAEMERCALTAYRDIAGVWTGMWGETQDISPGMTWTQEFADQTFCTSMTHYVVEVRKMLSVETSDYELAALTSLGYNIGLNALKKSTALRQHNAGRRQEASRAFNLFNKARNEATGQLEVVAGLTRRRALEQALYLTPDNGNLVMPQAVEPQSTLVKSPTLQTGVATGGAGMLATALSFTDDAKEWMEPLKTFGAQVADFIGVTPHQGIGIAVIAVAVVVVYQRMKQRQQGWA